MATKKSGSDDSYNSADILDLTQHDHLLKRISLTFGTEQGDDDYPYSSQKRTAISELTDNSCDEIRSGYGEWISIKFFEDTSVEVMDSGRGLPVDVSKSSTGEMVNGIYKTMGIIQSGGKFGQNGDASRNFTGGLNGVGASSTNHCSKMFNVTVYRDKKVYQLSFKDGVPGFFADETDPDSKFTPSKDLSKLKVSKDTRSAAEKKKYPTGTKIRAYLRDSVFSSDYPYDEQDIIERMRSTAYLVPDMHVEIYNERKLIPNPKTGKEEPQQELFHFEDGLEEFLDFNRPDKPITEKVKIEGEGEYIEKNVLMFDKEGKQKTEDLQRYVPFEIAFDYGEKYEHTIASFVNAIKTANHGVHVSAFERAMVKVFNEKIMSMRGLLTKNDGAPITEDYREGLNIIISVQVSEPNMPQTKDELKGNAVGSALHKAVTEELKKWVNSPKNADTMKIIGKKVATAAKNRQRAKEQRDLNRKKNEMKSSSLPAGLLDCELSGTEDAELYIAEGKSALSSLKGARNGKIHALLAIRGKIINAYKNPRSKLYKNKEVENIIKTLGAGSGKDFNIENMRYGRVFIAVDADTDGNNIATLIYALFWVLFKDVILQGKLYKIEPPLFVITTKQGKNSQKIYARDDDEQDRVFRMLDKKGIKYSSSRLKGLGEMRANDLEETSMNPETRVITQITIDDIEQSLETLDLVFSNDTERRKDWISEGIRIYDESVEL